MLTKEQKRAIEADAMAAAKAGKAPVDACPWPVASQERLHWLAVWNIFRRDK